MLAHVAGGDEIIARRFGDFLQQGGRINPLARRVVAARAGLGRIGAIVGPGLDVQRRARPHPRRQRIDAFTQLADDGDIGAAQFADFRGVDVEMDDPGVGRELGQLAGGAVVEPGADDDQQVAVLHRMVGGARAVHPQHPQHAWRMGRDGAQGVQGRNLRNAGRGDEGAQGSCRAADLHPAADIDQRLLRSPDRGLGGGDGVVIDARRLVGNGETVVVRSRLELHILGQIDQNRTGAARGGDMEGFLDRGGNLGGRADQDRMFHDRQGDAQDVDFLKGVSAHQALGDIAGDADDRHRIHHRIGDAGDQIGGAGA